MPRTPVLHMYCDASLHDSGIGGWAYTIWYRNQRIGFGLGANWGRTIQELELTPIIEGLRCAAVFNEIERYRQLVWTDCEYALRRARLLQSRSRKAEAPFGMQRAFANCGLQFGHMSVAARREERHPEVHAPANIAAGSGKPEHLTAARLPVESWIDYLNNSPLLADIAESVYSRVTREPGGEPPGGAESVSNVCSTLLPQVGDCAFVLLQAVIADTA